MNNTDLRFFIEHGYLHLKNCFDAGPGTIVERWKNEHWARYELDPDDPDSWPPKKRIPSDESVSVKEFAPKAYDAICGIMGGADKLKNPDFRWDNSFLMNYACGYGEEYVPANEQDIPDSNWHTDGIWFRHFLDSPEQGILGIVMWNDMKVERGNTVVALDSVGPIARHLMKHPEGLGPGEFPWKKIIRTCDHIIDIEGEAGDVVLVHPFTMHR
ncbi:MAG: hypothetical protein HRU15_14415, partial [Planctomycetes bacterium]|nr:hypothetical protein [Planctomycetota bacterium]